MRSFAFAITLMMSSFAFAGELSRLDWLEGQWKGQMNVGETEVDLSYSNHRGGLILGTMKTYPEGRETFWELLTIHEAGGAIRMTGLLYGSAKVDYIAELVSENQVIFKGLTANAPQRITIKKLSDNSISEQVEIADENGKLKSFIIVFKRK